MKYSGAVDRPASIIRDVYLGVLYGKGNPSSNANIQIKPVNSSPFGQDGRHFSDNIFRCTFVNENIYIFTKMSPKFVPKDRIDNNPALF